MTIFLKRFFLVLRRPSKRASIRLMKKHGETPASFIIRKAVPEDIPALAALHVKTFNETHNLLPNGPTLRVREYQWQEQFKISDANWFCFVIENSRGALAGFAKGIPYNDPVFPEISGELNKLYLLRKYQRLGLGSRLIGYVAREFINRSILSMLLFGEAGNPSNKFYEALGAERLYANNGKFHGGYVWKDVRPLALL